MSLPMINVSIVFSSKTLYRECIQSTYQHFSFFNLIHDIEKLKHSRSHIFPTHYIALRMVMFLPITLPIKIVFQFIRRQYACSIQALHSGRWLLFANHTYCYYRRVKFRKTWNELKPHIISPLLLPTFPGSPAAAIQTIRRGERERVIDELSATVTLPMKSLITIKYRYCCYTL